MSTSQSTIMQPEHYAAFGELCTHARADSWVSVRESVSTREGLCIMQRGPVPTCVNITQTCVETRSLFGGGGGEVAGREGGTVGANVQVIVLTLPEECRGQSSQAGKQHEGKMPEAGGRVLCQQRVHSCQILGSD